MTPEEKADELVDKFIEYTDTFGDGSSGEKKAAIQCAILCCDEIISAQPMYVGNLNPKWDYW